MTSFFNYTFIKYGIVGFSGLCIDFFVTWLCKEKFGLNKYLANSIGFVLAVINNYFLNKFYTFNGFAQQQKYQFLLFASIALIGLLINNIVILLVQNTSKASFYIAKAIAILIVFMWNYFANALFTFK